MPISPIPRHHYTALLDELEALLFVVWDARLEEHGVSAELRVHEWHVAVDAHKEVDALVSLVEVFLID